MPRDGSERHLVHRRARRRRPPISCVAARRGDVVLQLAEFGQPLVHQSGIDVLVEVRRVGAVLVAVGEEPAPVELRLLDEVEQLIVIVLGLTRVADDEVAAERRVGLALTDVGDPVEETLTVTPSTHPTQQRLGHVLQRQVEVRHTAGADRVDQRIRQIARVQVQEPHAVDGRSHRIDERHDRPGAEFVGTVLAVRREILRDEHDLARFGLADFGHDRLDVATALRAPEARNGAEPARTVASFGDLHVRPGCRRSWAAAG